MRFRHNPKGRRLPIKLDSTSNGEFAPLPLDPISRVANTEARDAATAHARKAGMSRRQFMVSTCGAASTLLAFNQTRAAGEFAAGSASRLAHIDNMGGIPRAAFGHSRLSCRCEWVNNARLAKQ